MIVKENILSLSLKKVLKKFFIYFNDKIEPFLNNETKKNAPTILYKYILEGTVSWKLFTLEMISISNNYDVPNESKVNISTECIIFFS